MEQCVYYFYLNLSLVIAIPIITNHLCHISPIRFELRRDICRIISEYLSDI